RLSLKESPTHKSESIIPNEIPISKKNPSIPRGEQLDIPPQPQPIIKSSPTRPQPITKTPLPESEPIKAIEEPKKAFVRHVAKPVADIERKPIPKQEQGLYDILSRPDPSAHEQPQNSTKVSDSIQRLYGDKFNDLSAGEQKYILDNQEVMRRITQKILDRYARSRIPDNIHTQDTNMIEFYLHPDGSISALRFLKNSQFSILDDTTKEVIELAYCQYPRPEQKTLIRYRVFYNLTGY
ncbi:TonB C-terminal domain-containing protein, partial [Sulfuricurvum sp.]|uniref:energy transducer TonB family protein n=1 Tax=Sulfuricurvum sp. TaxID=2025608 RepID=UPI0019C3546C